MTSLVNTTFGAHPDLVQTYRALVMAEHPEFTDAVEKGSQEVIGSLISKQDWEEEDKERLLKEYMTVRLLAGLRQHICI